MRSRWRFSASTLAFGYTVFGVVALVLFAAPMWYAWEVTVENGRREILHADAQRLSEVFHRDGAEGLRHFIDERVGLQIPNERFLLLTDATLRPLAGNLPRWPAGLPPVQGDYTLYMDHAGERTRVVFVRSILPGGYNLLVGRDSALFAPLTRYFWLGLIGAVGVLCGLGLLGGILIRRDLLWRVQSLRTTVTAIVRGDLSHRLPAPGRGDELDTLALTINGMLDQIEQLVHGVRNVSNSIAHDLRTPLAELRSRLEELLVTRPGQAETFAEIEAAVADVDRVIGVFNALLRLAEIDTGARRSGFVQVDLTEVASEAVEFYRPAAELKSIALAFHGEPVAIAGDPVMLAQAVSNLIDNAVKHGGDGKWVTVEVRRDDQGAGLVIVSDRGPGIRDEDKGKVTERFYRGDASRGTPGSGLGLSLVEAVARLHGGAVELRDNRPGVQVHVTFGPATVAAPPTETAAPQLTRAALVS